MTTTNMNNTMNTTTPNNKHGKRPSWISKFLWRCAGANVDVLLECPTSQSRYTGIGATVFFTAVMAFISMTYAMTSVFFGGDLTLPIILGLTWALMIFSLDRFIVNSMHVDEKDGFTRAKFVSGLPRLVMAVFIGIVVSTPIELRIFEQRINAQLVMLKEAERDAFVAGQTATSDSLSIAKAKVSSAALTDSLDIIREKRIKSDLGAATASLAYARSTHSGNLARLNKLNSQDGYTSQINALTSTIGGKKKNGEDYTSEAAMLATLKAQREDWRKGCNWYSASKACNASASEVRKYSAKVDELNNQLSTLYDRAEAKKANTLAQIDAAKAQADTLKAQNVATLKAAQGYTGSVDGTETYNHDLLDRMEALHTIMGEHPLSAGVAVVFLALMFIIIESAPTLFKMMIAGGAYEKRMAAIESKSRMESDASIYQAETMLTKVKSDLNDQINTAMDRLHSQLTKEISELNDELNTAMSISAEQNRLKAETAHKVNEATYQELARAQAEIVREAIAGWKKKEMENAKQHPEDYIDTTNVRTEQKQEEHKEQKTDEQPKAEEKETADAKEQKTDEQPKTEEKEPEMKEEKEQKKDENDWSKAA